MGLADFLKFGKKEEKTEEKKTAESQEDSGQESSEDAKYADKACALCGRDQAEKQWAGQYWHKKCFRQVKKGAKRMI